MKFLLVMFALAATSMAQSARPKASPETIQSDLLKIEYDVIHANETCDRQAFERVEAEEFIFTDSAGNVTNKKEDLESLATCHPRELKGEIDEVRVQTHGEVAIFNARLTQHPRNKEGQIVTRRNRFTDVFVWRDGRWQMVAGNSSRIPDPKPEASTK